MTGILRPVSGDGVVAHRGNLVVLVAAGLRTDAVLQAHAECVKNGGDGATLADALADLLTDGSVDAVAFGPSGRTGTQTTVAVFGHAFADVATEYGEQRLALKGSSEGVRSSLPGRLNSIKAGLGDVDAAGEPQRWGDLDEGVVHARGLHFVPDGAVAPGASAGASHTDAPEMTLDAVKVAEIAAAVEAAPGPDSTLAPPPEPMPAPPVTEPLAAPRPMPAPAVAATPTPAAPPASAAPAAVAPEQPTSPPPAGPPPGTPVTSEPQPEVFAPPQVDRSQPFASVLFVQAEGAAPQVEERAPLPVADAPLPPPAPNAEPAAHPAHDESVQVLGVYCKNGHFDDPSARYCAVCGISMAQMTLIPRPGPRPPLGVLVLDDGSIFSLDGDYVIGRNPGRDEDVSSGRARALRLDDRQGLLSRAHARVRLDGWAVQVIDLGSVNGTGVLEPGAPGWQRLPANQAVAIRPGTEVGVGERRLRYESHRNT